MVAMVRMESSAGVYSGKSGGESMKRPQKLAVMLVPTPPYEICGIVMSTVTGEAPSVSAKGSIVGLSGRCTAAGASLACRNFSRSNSIDNSPFFISKATANSFPFIFLSASAPTFFSDSGPGVFPTKRTVLDCIDVLEIEDDFVALPPLLVGAGLHRTKRDPFS